MLIPFLQILVDLVGQLQDYSLSYFKRAQLQDVFLQHKSPIESRPKLGEQEEQVGRWKKDTESASSSSFSILGPAFSISSFCILCSTDWC